MTTAPCLRRAEGQPQRGVRGGDQGFALIQVMIDASNQIGSPK
jgi:hypothetical protein